MLVIGLTGGIGSGKSTAADIFSDLGIPVLDTDQVARDVVSPGSPALEEIIHHFGIHVIDEHGQLDRSTLRQLVFAHAEMRGALEKIVHPRIRQQVADWLQQQNSPYCIIVVPLLIEKGWDKQVDRILVIDTPEELQLKRSSQRDVQSADDIQKIIDTQISREIRLAHADDVIHNTSSIKDLRQKVEQCHTKYLEMAKSKV